MEPDILRVPVATDLTLHVERYGIGAPPIVLLHGFGTSTWYWRRIAPALVRLPATVFAIDLPGYGDSDRSPDARYDTESQAERIEIAFSELRIAAAAMVGNDIGGNVALRVASRWPERVTGLAVINTVLEGSLDRGDLRDLRLGSALHAFRLATSVTGAAPLLRRYLNRATATGELPERLIARYLAAYVGKDGAEHLIGLARTVSEESWEREDTESVSASLMYVLGERDDTMKPGSIESIVARFPLAQLRRIADAGRLAAEDRPDELSALLAEHLGGFVRT